MSAIEHLGPQWQRMAISDILKLPSADLAGHGGGTVADLLPQRRAEVASDYGQQYSQLRTSMERDGQTMPVHVGPAQRVLRDYAAPRSVRAQYDPHALMFGNGHHRVAIAQDLGWTHMDVSHDMYDTDGGDASDLDDALDSYHKNRGR